MDVIDLTHVITEDMPVYPGSEPPSLRPVALHGADGYRETRLSLHSHTGTHIDPPAHILADGATLDRFPADRFVGRALVIDCRGAREGGEITRAHIEAYGDSAHSADFLLFWTGWDALWGTPGYYAGYPCLSADAVDCILEGSHKGLGFDVMSPDPVGSTELPRHKRLLGAGLILIENLCGLAMCGREPFLFAGLPLRVLASDGAPARCVAMVGT